MCRDGVGKLKILSVEEVRFIFEPIVFPSGDFFAFEVLTRCDNGPQGSSLTYYDLDTDTRRQIFIKQIQYISQYADLFVAKGVLVSVNVDADCATLILGSRHIFRLLKKMPFVRLEINEFFPGINEGVGNKLIAQLYKHFTLWLDDFGKGAAGIQAIRHRVYEFVKVDKDFFWKYHNRPIFPLALAKIKKYAGNKVIIEGVESTQYLAQAQQSGEYLMQGYLWHCYTQQDIANSLLPSRQRNA